MKFFSYTASILEFICAGYFIGQQDFWHAGLSGIFGVAALYLPRLYGAK